MSKDKDQQLQIKAKDTDLKGSYSNLMQIVHTKEEFILDFFLASPPQGVLVSRIVVNPLHTKRIIKTLSDNIKKYEENYGKGKIDKCEEVAERKTNKKIIKTLNKNK